MSNSNRDNTLRIECSNCSKVIRAPISMAGKTGKCPGCGNRIQIPDAPPPSKTSASREEATQPPRRPVQTTQTPDDSSSAGDSIATNKQKQPNKVSGGIQVLESRAVPAVWLLRITMLVMAVQIYLFWSLYESGRRSDLLEMVQMAVVVFWITFIVTGIFFLRWKYRANANLHIAGKRRLNFSPRGCCGYYFFPFLNFFFPMRAMLEIQSRSKAGVGHNVYIWWILLMLGTLIERAIFLRPMYVFHEGDWIVLIAITSLRIIAGLFLIRIIKAVTEKQRRYRLALEDSAT